MPSKPSRLNLLYAKPHEPAPKLNKATYYKNHHLLQENVDSNTIYHSLSYTKAVPYLLAKVHNFQIFIIITSVHCIIMTQHGIPC